MTAKELQEKLANDAELAKQFKGIKSVDELVAKASELGFELDAADIEKLTDAVGDLKKAAGGINVLAWTDYAIVCD